MKKLAYILTAVLLIAATICYSAAPVTVQASIFDWGKDDKSDEDEESFMDKIIDKAKEAGEYVEGVYDDVSTVVSMYKALDPNSITYQSELDTFIAAYNGLSSSRQTIVDATINIADGLDSLYDYLDEIVTIDQYSTKQLDINGEELIFNSNNKKIVEVSDTGVITAKKIGATSVTVTSKDGLSERKVNIVVKQPLLAKKLKISLGNAKKSITVMLSEDLGTKLNYKISKKTIIDSDIKDGIMTITAKKSGKAYIYVYGNKGTAKRYKITVTK